MDKLPPELLLKIAVYCDFAGVCAISKLNRRWNELIESNWNSLKKARVENIAWDDNYHGVYQGMVRDFDEKNVQCSIRHKSGRKKTLMLKVEKGSEEGDVGSLLERGWQLDTRADYFHEFEHERSVRSSDADKFLEDLFAPVFRRSTFDRLRLDRPKQSTLHSVIRLLEKFRPAIDDLWISIGGSNNETNTQQLADLVKIVELARPKNLRFSVFLWLTREEVREHFMQKIMHQKFTKISLVGGFLEKVGTTGPTGLGRLPNCDELHSSSQRKVCPLNIKEIVDVIEEWCNNERDIVFYDFERSDFDCITSSMLIPLRARNLSVHFEVVEEHAEYRMTKNVKRGDDQDELRLIFPSPCGQYWGGLGHIYLSTRRPEKPLDIFDLSCSEL